MSFGEDRETHRFEIHNLRSISFHLRQVPVIALVQDEKNAEYVDIFAVSLA